MPKIKTKKGWSKRFKLTKKGKVKRQRAGRGHLLAHKTRKRKRQLRKQHTVFKGESKTIAMFLPH